MTPSKFRPSPATVIAVVALFVALGGAAVAATGGNFILGQSNGAGSKTSLTAGLSDRALAITNLNTGGSATALGLNVDAGRPPLIVNSSTKVAHLNADLVDGIDFELFRAPLVLQFSAPFGTPSQEIGSIAGVIFRASCSFTGDLSLNAKFDVAPSNYLHESLVKSGGVVGYRESDDAPVNTIFDLLGTVDDDVIGHFVYSNTGRFAAVGDFLAEEEPTHCRVLGTVTPVLAPL